MADIHLYTDSSSQLTSVSNIFIDEFMPDANGEFVKVYLYLLRCIGSNAQNCSISAIADLFMHTDKDILRALRYWEKQGVLTLDYDAEGAVCGVHFMDLTASAGGAGSTGSVAGAMANADSSADSVNGMIGGPASVIASQAATDILQNNSGITSVQTDIKHSGTSVTQANIDMQQTNAGITSAQAGRVQANISQTSANSAAKANAKPARKEYSLDDIKNVRKDPDISELFFIIEAY